MDCCRSTSEPVYVPCHTHKKPLKHFCTYHSCLQMLCNDCITPHKDLHRHREWPNENIVQFSSVQAYYEENLRKEKAKVGKIESAEIIVGKQLEELLYGSKEAKANRFKQQSANNVPGLLKLIEGTNQYVVTPGFKERYFALLDSIMQEAN